MSDRLNAMFNHADTFIALLGGLGTLEEIFHISPWAHIHYKPIGLLNINGFYDNLLSFIDQVVEHKFLTSSAQQIIISAVTAEQLIDQLQSFIHVIDPYMSHINWSTEESRKKLRLDLSLCLWILVSFGFINSILFCFVISYICLSVFQVCQCSFSDDVFYTLFFYLMTLRTMSRSGWGERVVVDIKKKN